MPQVRLHSIAAYDRGAKVRWLLNELQIPFEDHRMDQAFRESAKFLRLNP
jgi:glutathione S-transferase